MGETIEKGLYATMIGWRIDPSFVILYFLPVNQSLSLIIQFYGKGNYFSLISLEWLGILLGFYLLRGSIHATVVAQLQLQHIDEVGNFYHHINPARSYHLLYFHPATDGVEDGAQNQAVAFLHIHAGKLLVHKVLALLLC